MAFIAVSCTSQNCETINSNFSSYGEAVKTVRGADFNFTDKCDTKSSWIKSAKYYSCDNVKGYLIFKTDKKTYIHKDLSLDVWRKFKNAESIGSYYARNIKGRYQLKI